MTDVPALQSATSTALTSRWLSHPQHLRLTYAVLTGLVDDPDLMQVDLAADPAEIRQMLEQLSHLVQRHLDEAAAAMQPTWPMVFDPARLDGVMSRQGQPLTSVITSDVAPTSGLSSAQVWMPPHHTSFAHLHEHTDVGVLVMYGRAITLWWDENEELHELPQEAGQHLLIPFGVPHAAINPYDVPVIAAEFRSNPVFSADNVLLPYLDDEVRAVARHPAAA